MDELLGWAAGFLEGDGTISCNARRYIAVSFGSIDPQLLYRFRDAVEAGNVNGPYTPRGVGRWSKQPQFFFTAYARGADIVSRLLPLFGTAKRQQTQRALQKLEPRFVPASLSKEIRDSIETDERLTVRILMAWASGFFDAEGCFSFSRRSGLCASITHTDEEILLRFDRIVGIGRLYGPYLSKNSGSDGFVRKPHYFYRVQGHERVQALAAMLWTWLSDAKRAQARAGLARVLVCHKGHLKKPGHSACAECTREYWASYRASRPRESQVAYLTT